MISHRFWFPLYDTRIFIKKKFFQTDLLKCKYSSNYAGFINTMLNPSAIVPFQLPEHMIPIQALLLQFSVSPSLATVSHTRQSALCDLIHSSLFCRKMLMIYMCIYIYSLPFLSCAGDCQANMDIVIAMDASTSLSLATFNDMKKFLYNFASR